MELSSKKAPTSQLVCLEAHLANSPGESQVLSRGFEARGGLQLAHQVGHPLNSPMQVLGFGLWVKRVQYNKNTKLGGFINPLVSHYRDNHKTIVRITMKQSVGNKTRDKVVVSIVSF